MRRHIFPEFSEVFAGTLYQHSGAAKRHALPFWLQRDSTESEPMQNMTVASDAASAIYKDKPATYFANARHDIVESISTNADSAVLELGCGAGGTGRAMLGAGKAGRYVGIELSETAAAMASDALSQVLVGDVEAIDLSALEGQFDALIISEVLEHLRDPWTTLQRLVMCLKPGGLILASSPNISHWRVIRDLMSGRFDYAPTGVMDETHLRWFTPRSYRQLFEGAGVTVDSVKPLVPRRWKAKLFGWLSGGRLDHLFIVQIMVIGRRR